MITAEQASIRIELATSVAHTKALKAQRTQLSLAGLDYLPSPQPMRMGEQNRKAEIEGSMREIRNAQKA